MKQPPTHIPSLTDYQTSIIFKCLRGWDMFNLKGGQWQRDNMYFIACANKRNRRERVHGNAFKVLQEKELFVPEGEVNVDGLTRYRLNKPVFYRIIMRKGGLDDTR